VECGKRPKEGTSVIMRIKGKKVKELKRRKKFIHVMKCKKQNLNVSVVSRNVDEFRYNNI
jgi:hypothetical protein